MSLGHRLAKLERATTGDEGAGVWGVREENFFTRATPDVVTVGPTGETLTEAAFRARYPRGVLIVRTVFLRPGDGDAAA